MRSLMDIQSSGSRADLSTLFDASLSTSEPPKPRLIFFAFFQNESEGLR